MLSRKKLVVARSLNGILLLDKPCGLTSNKALQIVKSLFCAKKAGHTGSLDPLATGLLPICFGEATKISGKLLGACKAYDTVAGLGVTTDTDDTDGHILRRRVVSVLNLDDINVALNRLTGCIQQRPPIYSALKQGGERLYAKARRGEKVIVAARQVEVHKFELKSITEPEAYDMQVLRLHVECGSGTYVRSLVRDFGEALHCGAHVVALRRIWVEPFFQPRMWTLDALRELAEDPKALDACLLPVETGMVMWPSIMVTAQQARHLGHGQPVIGDFLPMGEVAIFNEDNHALGLGKVMAFGVLKPQRLFSFEYLQSLLAVK